MGSIFYYYIFADHQFRYYKHNCGFFGNNCMFCSIHFKSLSNNILRRKIFSCKSSRAITIFFLTFLQELMIALKKQLIINRFFLNVQSCKAGKDLCAYLIFRIHNTTMTNFGIANLTSFIQGIKFCIIKLLQIITKFTFCLPSRKLW